MEAARTRLQEVTAQKRVIEGELGEARAVAKLLEEQVKALKDEVRLGKRRDGLQGEWDNKVRDLEAQLLAQRNANHQQAT